MFWRAGWGFLLEKLSGKVEVLLGYLLYWGHGIGDSMLCLDCGRISVGRRMLAGRLAKLGLSGLSVGRRMLAGRLAKLGLGG